MSTTCGQGLAQHAELPSKIGELIALLADTLEAHIPSIDLDDPYGRTELRAYASLAGQYRRIADQLQSAANEMRAAADLPMARHNTDVLTDPRTFQPFRDYVVAERELVQQLEQELERDEAMVAQVDAL